MDWETAALDVDRTGVGALIDWEGDGDFSTVEEDVGCGCVVADEVVTDRDGREGSRGSESNNRSLAGTDGDMSIDEA